MLEEMHLSKYGHLNNMRDVAAEMDKTLAKLKKAQEGSQQFFNKWDKFKDDFDKVTLRATHEPSNFAARMARVGCAPLLTRMWCYCAATKGGCKRVLLCQHRVLLIEVLSERQCWTQLLVCTRFVRRNPHSILEAARCSTGCRC